MKTPKLIPLLDAYIKCTVVENTQRLHNDVLAGTVETIELRGKLFVSEATASGYFPEESQIQKPSPEDLENFVKEVKANSELFKTT